jgi:hypothetical protein
MRYYSAQPFKICDEFLSDATQAVDAKLKKLEELHHGQLHVRNLHGYLVVRK